MEREPVFNSEQEKEPQVEIISAETLQQLNLIWQKLQGFIQKDKELRDSHGPLSDDRAIKEHRKQFMQDYEARKEPGETMGFNQVFREADKRLFAPFEQETLKVAKEMMNYLDRMAVFDYKFTTTGASFDHPDKSKGQDSIYYMTPEGATLRLKMVHAAQSGLNRIIVPFMEKIVFNGKESIIKSTNDSTTFRNDQFSFTPKEKYYVKEYMSEHFYSLIHEDNYKSITSDFKSMVETIENNDNTTTISVNDMKFTHEGHPVDEILFFPSNITSV